MQGGWEGKREEGKQGGREEGRQGRREGGGEGGELRGEAACPKGRSRSPRPGPARHLRVGREALETEGHQLPTARGALRRRVASQLLDELRRQDRQRERQRQRERERQKDRGKRDRQTETETERKREESALVKKQRGGRGRARKKEREREKQRQRESPTHLAVDLVSDRCVLERCGEQLVRQQVRVVVLPVAHVAHDVLEGGGGKLLV